MKQPTSSMATSMESTHGSTSSMATAMVVSTHQKKREQYCKRSELEVGEWPWNEAMLGPDAGLPTTAWLRGFNKMF